MDSPGFGHIPVNYEIDERGKEEKLTKTCLLDYSD
jgi:hypothetical protein